MTPPARRLFRASGAAPALRRAGASLPAVVQIAAAATVGYVVSRYLLGHESPIFASTVAITVLGFARDARPVRVAESSVAIILGILLAELLLAAVGRGAVQLFVVLVVTFLVARLLSPSPGFAAAAGVQSALVTLFPAPPGAEVARAIDGVVGATVALLFTALIPRSPLREVRREAHRLFTDCTEGAVEIAEALRTADEPLAARALERLRTTQPVLDAWTTSLDSAIAVARVSPFLRHRYRALLEQRRLLRGMDLACRNLRVLARRSDALLRDGRPRPALAGLVGEVAAALALLAAAVDDPAGTQAVRDRLASLARRLAPGLAAPDASLEEGMGIVLMRPLAVDLLTAAGSSEDEARSLLPPLGGADGQ